MRDEEGKLALAPSDAGMTWQHITAVSKLCEKENLFLFVRPSTDDTRLLIEKGFATKSMDIHDKSSDWGPHAGLVPVDAEFSKRPPGLGRNLNPMKVHPHGEAFPTQLVLPSSMLSSLLGKKLMSVARGSYELFMPLSFDTDKPEIRYNVNAGNSAKWLSARPKGMREVGTSDFRLFRPTNAPSPTAKDTLFVMVRDAGGWAVYWTLGKHGQTYQGPLIPLVVWAYRVQGKLTPVTGDYDLWMVAPHMSQTPPELHHATSIRPDAHGQSAVSGYTALLLRRLNKACERSLNPVFNHGAEAQNVGFTQAHDAKLVMFTASGRARMVNIGDVPRILSDLHKTGYIVSINKQWTSRAPILSGKALSLREDEVQQARDAHKDKQTIDALLTDVKKTRKTMGEMQLWYDELRGLLEKFDSQGLDGLTKQDLPNNYRVADAKMRELALTLQRTMLDMTRDDLSKSQADQAGAIRDDVWFEWVLRHQNDLDAIRKYWGFPY